MTIEEQIRQCRQTIVRINESIWAQRLCLATVLNNKTAYIGTMADSHINMFTKVINHYRIKIAEVHLQIKELQND